MEPLNNNKTKSILVSPPYTNREQQCINKGIRITRSRRAILTILEQTEYNLTVDEIYSLVLTTDSELQLSFSTIYSNIKGLADAGIVQRTKTPYRKTHYSLGDQQSDPPKRD